jgi:hypothetical protein
MPIAKYFKGHGNEVAEKMKQQYGEKKGEKVFYATAAKNKMRPDDKPKRKDIRPAHRRKE